MDENEFWIAVWRWIGLTLFGCVASVAGCVSNTNYQIRQEVASGKDPLAIACAHGQDGSGTSCALLAAKR